MSRLSRAAAAGIAALVLWLAAPTPASARPGSPKKASQKAKVAPPKAEDPESRWQGEPISLDLKDADLKDVLRTFAELAKINIAVDPEVKGSVTVRLNDVPWDQALDLILRMNDLGYVLEGRILRIGKPEKLIRSD